MSDTQNSKQAKKATELEPEERQRLFAHAMHEETVFYNRLNFFMVCESLLFAATISGLSGNNRALDPIIIPICVLGILVSLLWWFAQVNKLILYKTLVDRLETFEEMKESFEMADSRRLVGRIPGWSASSILAHAFPALFMLTWLYLTGYLVLFA